MNKLVIVGLAGFGLGMATGAGLLYFLGKKKEKVETSEEVKDVLNCSEPEPADEKVETVKEVSDYNELISDLQYRDQNDDDMAADPLTEEEKDILDNHLANEEYREFKEKNWGRIEEISREEFEKFLYQNDSMFADWEGEDLYFFQDEQVVTDSIGSLFTAEQVSQNLGDILDTSGFKNDPRDHLYVACYDVETIFDIKKELQTRDEFFA